MFLIDQFGTIGLKSGQDPCAFHSYNSRSIYEHVGAQTIVHRVVLYDHPRVRFQAAESVLWSSVNMNQTFSFQGRGQCQG